MTHDTSGYPQPASAAGGPPTTQVARDQAGQVGGAAADAGRHVAGTAAEQAGQVAEQARREAKDLYREARNQVTEQARGGQQKVGQTLRALADELREMAGGEHHGPASDLAAQAAGRVQDLAGWLDDREPGDLIQEVRNLARRRPGAFLVGAALAGVLAGRLTRGVIDANRSDDTSPTGYPGGGYPAAPPPVATPHPGSPYPGSPPVPPTPPPVPMPYDRPGGALPPQGPLDPPADPRPYAPGTVDPESVPPTRATGPAHALRPEGTTVGDYVDDLERGGVPPRYDPDGSR